VRLIPAGTDAQGRPHDDMRWSRFKNMAPAEMFDVLSNQVFPFLRTLGRPDGRTFATT
jgi:type I restriction enzyme M protein